MGAGGALLTVLPTQGSRRGEQLAAHGAGRAWPCCRRGAAGAPEPRGLLRLFPCFVTGRQMEEGSGGHRALVKCSKHRNC